MSSKKTSPKTNETDISEVSVLSNTAISTLKLWQKTRPDYYEYLHSAKLYYDSLTPLEVEALYACETHVQIAEFIGVLPTFTKDNVLAATTASNWLKTGKKERLIAMMLGAALIHFKSSNSLTDSQLLAVLNSNRVAFRDCVYAWQYRPTLLNVVLAAAQRKK